MEIRLNKYLAGCGYSRRAADTLIERGDVTVNGRPAVMGEKLLGNERVTVRGVVVRPTERKRYIALNKPMGVICTMDDRFPDNLRTLVDVPERLFPVGRLDVESTGLLILTNDGMLANTLMHPRYAHEKEYRVMTHAPVSDEELRRLREGVLLEDGMTQPAIIRRIDDALFVITLTEGRNRQIRRMCESIGHQVKALKRTRMHTLILGGLDLGAWRELRDEEVRSLMKPSPSSRKHSTRPRRHS